MCVCVCVFVCVCVCVCHVCHVRCVCVDVLMCGCVCVSIMQQTADVSIESTTTESASVIFLVQRGPGRTKKFDVDLPLELKRDGWQYSKKLIAGLSDNGGYLSVFLRKDRDRFTHYDVQKGEEIMTWEKYREVYEAEGHAVLFLYGPRLAAAEEFEKSVKGDGDLTIQTAQEQLSDGEEESEEAGPKPKPKPKKQEQEE